MSMRLLYAAAIILALAASALTAVEIMFIGEIYRDKSLYSYMLKTGDTDAGSRAALAHIHGSAAYGRKVAIRIAIGAGFFGLLAGMLITQWWLRKTRRA